MKIKKVAIVQPYFFPYIGYFQLINLVDCFIFYDDVNYIKKGWINRNNLLVNGFPHLFTVPLIKPSQNKLINEIELSIDDKWITTFLKKMNNSYSKAPYFEVIFNLVKTILKSDCKYVSQLAIESVIAVSSYLEFNTDFKVSSEDFSETKGMERADRLIEITKKLGGKEYINPIGGVELYTKDVFNSNSLDLKFLKADLVPYKQFDNKFVSGLSIIDVLMFNDVNTIKRDLLNCTLI